MSSKEINSWNANKYRKHAGFVSDLATPVVKLLDPKRGENILDIGCGDGILSLTIKRHGSNVIGIDLSENMVDKAREYGLDARVMSVTNMPFNGEFDAIFSNAMLHWVNKPKLAVKNIAKALRMGGRFVAEFGGYGNVSSIIKAMEQVFKKHPEYGKFNNAWFFPTADEYKTILEEYGFEVKYIELIPRPTQIDDISNWLMLFTNGITKNLSSKEEENFRYEVREILKSTNYSRKDGWIADYVRIRVKAYLKDKKDIYEKSTNRNTNI